MVGKEEFTRASRQLVCVLAYACRPLTECLGQIRYALPIHDIVQEQSTIHAGNNVAIDLLRPLDPMLGVDIKRFEVKFNQADRIYYMVHGHSQAGGNGGWQPT
jgi:hypothetical protein